MSLVDFVDELKKLVKEQIHNIHTALPAEIVSIDGTTGRVCVKPKAQMRFSNGKIIDFPLISGVPLVMPQSGIAGAAIVFPVKSGDQCLLVFSEQSLDYWLENGMNIAQISYLLGHENIQTTMVYLDITTEQEEKALETLEDENQRIVGKKWKSAKGKMELEAFLGLYK